MATFTATLTEELVLDGDDYGATRLWTVTDAAYAFKQNFLIPTAAAQDILIFDTAVGAGSIVRSNFRYARIRNADSTNYVTLCLTKASAATVYLRLDAGEFFILTHTAIDVDASGGAFVAFEDLDVITAQANTAAVKVEVLVVTA